MAHYDLRVPARLPLIATLAVVAALAAGCGGGTAQSSTTAGSGTSSSAPAVKADGAAIFTDEGCSSCHTLEAVGAKGITGPNLDELKPDVSRVVEQVTDGGGGMPGYGGRLKPEEIRAVAEFVASKAGG